MTSSEAGQLAHDFLMTDLDIPTEEQEWFCILTSRPVEKSWYVVEIGVEGLPDKWILQVWDTSQCDPSYTFVSPIKAASGTNDLEELPEVVAAAIASERLAQAD